MGQFSLAFVRGVCSCPGSATDASGFWGINYFSSVCNADRCGAVFPRFERGVCSCPGVQPMLRGFGV